jgi:hypothetical protein
MLVAWTSDAAYALLYDVGWSVSDTAYADQGSGRPDWPPMLLQEKKLP